MPAITSRVDAFPAFWIVNNTERCPLTFTILVCGETIAYPGNIPHVDWSYYQSS